MKRIIASLNSKSLLAMVDEVKKYQQELDAKTSKLVKLMADEGIAVTKTKVSGITSDNITEPLTVSVKQNGAYNQYVAIITLSGKDALFIEFGTGVHYNIVVGSYPHPEGQTTDGIVGIGQYGSGLGRLDSWHYTDESGNEVETQGNPPYAPLWQGKMRIQEKVEELARKVFK